jgi:hypothetical protein
MPRNQQIAPHVGRLSRSQVWAKRGCYKGQKASTAPEKTEQPHHVEKQVGGANNGGVRLVPTQKAPRFYAADDVKKPKKSRKVQNPHALRSSITPGTVLILLAGRFKGKRVVFLKQLASGLLLVTGPYKINGVPLRRVNQAYVIATSTKIDLCDLKVRLCFCLLPPVAYFTDLFPCRLTTRSTTTTFPSQSRTRVSPLRKSSSRVASPSRRRPSPHLRRTTRNTSTTTSLPKSRRLPTLPNTSVHLGVSRRANSLMQLFSNTCAHEVALTVNCKTSDRSL